MMKLNNIYRLIIASIIPLMFVACSDDDGDDQVKTHSLNLIPYCTLFSDSNQVSEVRTRATGLPDGFVKYSVLYPSPDIAYATIKAILVSKDEDNNWISAEKGIFSYVSNDNWSSTVKVKPSQDYYIYGYMPANAASKATVSSSDYASGTTTMKIEGLNSVTSSDVCVVVGVKKKESGVSDITDSGITQGQYSFTSSVQNTDDYVYLLLDHLYSCVNLEYSVSPYYMIYNTLRTIKLTKVVMQTATGPKDITATVTLPKSSDSSLSCVFENGSTGSTTAEVYSNTEGLQLTTTDQSVPSYFFPGESPITFNVISTYDVYDRKGNIVRKNCQATNKITLQQNLAGKCYTIHMVVTPTYLYQLSEAELDNPTIKVGD